MALLKSVGLDGAAARDVLTSGGYGGRRVRELKRNGTTASRDKSGVSAVVVKRIATCHRGPARRRAVEAAIRNGAVVRSRLEAGGHPWDRRPRHAQRADDKRLANIEPLHQSSPRKRSECE